ncbi:MAG: hypothetical protein ACRC3H_07615 [Lachnospiraceae bacterium]
MKIMDLIGCVEEGEKVCIQDLDESILEINDIEHISNEYTGCKVVRFYSESYPAYSTTGITFVVEPENA